MATIVSTELEIREGTTASGTLVGQKITESGSPASINADISTLGVNLSPGKQYCARARCTNSDAYTSDFCPPYPFRTLILAEIVSATTGCGGVEVEGDLTYDIANYMAECGVYVSTSASGTSAVKKAAADETDFGQFTVPGLNEHTTYYMVPFATDTDGRTYIGDWADAEQITTPYNAPVVTISNLATTYNSITGNVNVSTSDSTVTNVYLEIRASGGGTVWVKNLSNAKGVQTFTIANGDTADSSTPSGQLTITLNPSTEYQIRVYATNGELSGCTGNGYATATTAQQQTSTIAITSVTNITPTSAVVNLSYGDGNGGQQQGGNDNQ